MSLPGAPKKWRSSGSSNLAALRSQKTPVQAGTRRARNQESEPPFQRDSRICWQPEEKEMSVSTRRPLCREGKRPRTSEKQIAEQVSVLFLLKLKFRRYQSSEKLSLCRGNTRKLTAAQRSFRDWCSGGQGPGAHGYPVGHYSEELQRTTARIGCPNSHLKRFFFSKFNMHIMFI